LLQQQCVVKDLGWAATLDQIFQLPDDEVERIADGEVCVSDIIALRIHPRSKQE
jgi:hypothetical protein